MIIQLTLILTFSTSVVSAATEVEKTEAGIVFEEKEKSIESNSSEPPIHEYQPEIHKPGETSLPKLGQMITSFVLLLSGVACLIICFGVISLKKIYNIDR